MYGGDFMKLFLILIVLVFAVFGFSEFLHNLKLFLIFPRGKMHSHLVVELENNTAEQQLLFVCEQYAWYGNSFADYIVPSFEKLDAQTCERCKKIAEKRGIKTQ